MAVSSSSKTLLRAVVLLCAAASLSVLVIVALPARASAADAPKPPHALQGYEDCLLCHAPGKSASAVPGDHSGYGTSSCTACHASNQAKPAAPAVAQVSLGDNGQCLSCHNNPSLQMQLVGGEALPLYVDAGGYTKSVHGGRLACTDCHTNITNYPHSKVPYADRRAFTIAYYDSCKRCHFSNYTKTLDSVHFAALGSGDLQAPVCTDCHGAHNVSMPAEPRSKISQACGTCHSAVLNDYVGSVHGKALQEDNPDVPTCTNCHGVHSITTANSTSFRLASTALCASCHENSQLMSKYGLSANVLKTYLDDFHGRTVGFYQQQGEAREPSEPLCVDCHGIHDIKSTKDPASPVIKANLQATCQKCHQGASPNFPAAWMGHYEPGPDKASLVYYIRLYYWILIPMMLGGLTLHIGLDLWRLARNR